MPTTDSERHKWYVMAVIALGTIGAVILSTSFNVAVPALMAHFHIGNDEVQLAVTSFMVTSTIAMLPTPWLLQRFGLRASFLGAVALLTVSSLAGSFSPTFNLLLVARSLQGVCAGILYPLGTFAVMSLFPPSQQGRASGLLGFSIVLAPAVSPALGGIIIDHFGWEAVFYISIPFCLVALFGGWRHMPGHAEEKTTEFDWSGMLLLSIMTLAFLGCITHFQGADEGNFLLYIELLLASGTLVAFLHHAKHSPRALVSIAIFRRPLLLMGLVISSIYGFGIYGSTYLIPLYLQTVMDLTATHAGAILVPGGIGLALSLPLAGWLADRSSPYVVVLAGLIMLALSFAGMAVVANRAAYDYFIELTLLGRVGSGLIIASLNQAAMRGLHGPLMAQSAMFIGYVRQLGGVLGVAAVAVYIAWRSTALGGNHMDSQAQVFAEAFLISTLIFALAALVSWRMQYQSRMD
ncbi:MAG: DHA2 family efflux MFS transporter permease subunit [Sterolibacterium sp.]|nr:DHA2 family efflux MFS transporter permease subunit [Sterolibacterium sp.]